MLACGAWRVVELQKALHMAIRARPIRPLLFAPSSAKN